MEERTVFYHPEVYPFRTIDTTIPLDRKGFLYILVFVPKPHKIYIGATMNLSQRLQQHNNGTGDQESHNPRDLLWEIGCYICGLADMNGIERMCL